MARTPITRLAKLAILAAGGVASYLWLTWPDVERLGREPPSTTAFLEAQRRLAERGEGPEPRWTWVPYAAISPHLKHAALVAEDIDFFSHNGFALEEIRAAVRDTLQEGKALRGASTITQQLAKNLWLSPSRNPWRKVKEALLTRQLERELSKRRILEIYLNVVELGPGIYGAEAAARHYFGLSASRLSRSQAAALAAGLSRPKQWHPGADSSGYRRRVALIEARMRRSGWLLKEL